MAITRKQAWISTITFGAASLALSFTNAPTNNGMVICCGLVGTTTNTLAASDNFGDTGGGAWQTGTGPNTDTNLSQRTYIFWRQIGTGATGKQVTLTSNSGTPHINIYLVELAGQATSAQPDATATAKVNQSSANPALVAYTAAANSYEIGYFSSDGATATAGAGGGGFGVQITDSSWNNDYIEDQIWAAGGSLVTNLTDSGVHLWTGQGMAFKVISSAAALGIIVPSPLSGVGSGNRFLGDRLS